MEYFPLFAAIRGRPVLVVGGGDVALRKIKLLLDAGGKITVVAPLLHPEIAKRVAEGRLRHECATYRSQHLERQLLVIAATNSSRVNTRVSADAERCHLLCNVVDDPDRCSFITPAIVDRAPLLVAISSAGAAPVLARLIREKLERELPQRLGELATLARRWRQRVKRMLGSVTARRRFWEALFTGGVSDRVYAGSIQRAEHETEQLLSEHTSGHHRQRTGEAWLVGAGPGDPALLTIRAQQLLQAADVILHDRLVSPEILAMARRDAEFIDVGKPIPGNGCASSVQSDTNELLVNLVSKGLRVCRLKGGDPFIFGRGGEEITALTRAGLRYQIVPGITAAAACAAYAGIPLTHRDHAQSVMFLTGHGKQSVDTLDWPSLARGRQTLAIYMGVSRFSTIASRLQAGGRGAGTPVAIIERGTTTQQRVVSATLGTLAAVSKREQVCAPSILIVGDVAHFAKTQQWFQHDQHPVQTLPIATPIEHAARMLGGSSAAG